MNGFHATRANEFRLRIVFDDDEVSVGFPVDATFGDLAEWVHGLAKLHDGVPVAIDIKTPDYSKGTHHGTH